MPAVPKPLQILPAKGTRQIKINKCLRIPEKSDPKECKSNLECRKSKKRSKPW